MGGVLGATFQRPHDHGFDTGSINGAWRPRARLIVQPATRATRQNAAATTHGLPVQPQLGRHFLFLTAFRAGQHDPRSQSQRLRGLPTHRQRLQFGTLIIAQYQGRKSLGRHQILRRCCSRHLWHSDANLLRIYDCELVTRDASGPATCASLRSTVAWRRNAADFPQDVEGCASLES